MSYEGIPIYNHQRLLSHNYLQVHQTKTTIAYDKQENNYKINPINKFNDFGSSGTML